MNSAESRNIEACISNYYPATTALLINYNTNICGYISLIKEYKQNFDVSVSLLSKQRRRPVCRFNLVLGSEISNVCTFNCLVILIEYQIRRPILVVTLLVVTLKLRPIVCKYSTDVTDRNMKLDNWDIRHSTRFSVKQSKLYAVQRNRRDADIYTFLAAHCIHSMLVLYESVFKMTDDFTHQ